jgi:hypothetical protein
MAPWLIITGSGLDDGIYWRLRLQSVLIKINYSAVANLSTSQIPSPRSILVLVLRCTPDWLLKVSLRLTVSQSVCLGVESRMGLMTRCFFLFESYCPVHVGRPLWRVTDCSESYVTTDGQPASLSWNKAPFWGLRPDLYYCLTVAVFFYLGRPL